ncbi:hypothetical protein LguiA_014951 [Lonicera macranthoides]
MVNELEEIYIASSKKPKLPKAPPQRGLGVARLEKILREQTHHIDDNTQNKVAYEGKSSSPCNISSLPLSHNFPITGPPPPPPIHDSIIGHLPLFENLDPFILPPLPMTTLCSNSLGGGGRDGGGGHVFLPTMWNSCDFNEEQRKMDSGFPFPLYYLDTTDPFWPSNMNGSLPSGLSSSSSSIEPPSNQNSYNYKSIWPEEPQASEIPLYAKKEWQAEQTSKKDIMDFETHDSSFLTLGPPSSSSQSTDEFNSTQIGSTCDSQQWWGQGESSHQETFYSLLLQKAGLAGAETTSNSINKRGEEAAEHIIDLNLKMSVGSSSIDDDKSLHFSKKSN